MKGLARLVVFRCQLLNVDLTIYEEIERRYYTVVSLFTGMQCLANSGFTSRWSSTRAADEILNSGN